MEAPFLNQPEALARIYEIATADSFVLYCGAGVTLDRTGLSWRDLIQKVVAKSYSSGWVSKEARQGFELMLSAGLPPQSVASGVVAAIRHRMPGNENQRDQAVSRAIDTMIKELLYQELGWSQGLLLRNIAALAFQAACLGKRVLIVTTNYDDYIQQRVDDMNSEWSAKEERLSGVAGMIPGFIEYAFPDGDPRFKQDTELHTRGYLANFRGVPFKVHGLTESDSQGKMRKCLIHKFSGDNETLGGGAQSTGDTEGATSEPQIRRPSTIEIVHLHGHLPHPSSRLMPPEEEAKSEQTAEECKPKVIFSEEDYALRVPALANWLKERFVNGPESNGEPTEEPRNVAVLVLGSGMQDAPLLSALLQRRAPAGDRAGGSRVTTRRRPDSRVYVVGVLSTPGWQDGLKAADAPHAYWDSLREAEIARGEHLDVELLSAVTYAQVAQVVEEIRVAQLSTPLRQDKEKLPLGPDNDERDFTYAKRLQNWGTTYWGAAGRAPSHNYQEAMTQDLRRGLAGIKDFICQSGDNAWDEPMRLEMWLRRFPNNGKERGLTLVATSAAVLYQDAPLRTEDISGIPPGMISAVQAFEAGKPLLDDLEKLGFTLSSTRWKTFFSVPIYFEWPVRVPGLEQELPAPVGSVPVGVLTLASQLRLGEADPTDDLPRSARAARWSVLANLSLQEKNLLIGEMIGIGRRLADPRRFSDNPGASDLLPKSESWSALKRKDGSPEAKLSQDWTLPSYTHPLPSSPHEVLNIEQKRWRIASMAAGVCLQNSLSPDAPYQLGEHASSSPSPCHIPFPTTNAAAPVVSSPCSMSTGTSPGSHVRVSVPKSWWLSLWRRPRLDSSTS